MKVLTFILLVLCLSSAATGFSQINLSEKNIPLSKLFKKIEQQSGYDFLYPSDAVEKAGNVSVQVQNATVEETVSVALKGTALTFTIKEKTVIIKEKQISLTTDNSLLTSSPPPPIDIKGRIIDEEGKPVVASVQIKGTNKGTTTNENGEFELKAVDQNAILVISGVSIQSFEWNINGRTDLGIINAKIKNSIGEEVKIEVNTGYQRISKERFVGSYSQLDSADFHRRDGMNIIDRLDGTVTGVFFDKKQSGSSLEDMQIRGISTLGYYSDKTPLVIVDNFPFKQSLDAINPNDVESISVLKDAAATSIWGARAGNGVIVITTKKGKYNQPIKIAASSIATVIEKPDLYYYPRISVGDVIDVEQMLFRAGKYDGDLSNTSTWPVVSPVVDILAERRAGAITAEDSAAQINSLKSSDIRRDLNKYVYRHAITQQYYLDISGGSNAFNYNFSGGYNRGHNNIRNSEPDDQYTLSAKAQVRPVKNLEFTTSINFTQSNQQGTNFSFQTKTFPYSRLADAEGNPIALANMRTGFLDTVGSGHLLDWKYRPLDETALANTKNISRFISVSNAVSYKIKSWLSLSANYQYNTEAGNNRNLNNVNTFFARDLIDRYTNLSQTNPALRNPVPVGGILDIAHNESVSQNFRGQIDFNKLFSAKHLITSLLAAETVQTQTSGDINRMYGYDEATGSYKSTIDYSTFFPTYDGIGGTSQIPNGSKIFPSTVNRYVSFLGNISYTYNSRYSFYASARKDGSNIFGVNTNKKWKPLWSVGLSWDISRESFFRIDWLSTLRLRASYGLSGNPGNISGRATMTYGVNPDPYSGFAVAFLNGAPNPDLKWENVRMINSAIDFGLFNNRVSGSLDVFQKKSSDVIGINLIPPSSGVLSLTTNVADLSGGGFELAISSKNINGVFSWQTTFGLSHARMVVDKIILASNNAYPKAQDMINYSLNAYPGQIAYGISSYKWAGLDPATGNPQGYLNGHISTDYNAIFNDSLQNQVFHGSAIPLYSGFVGNTFSWKNFSLSANITYRLDFYFRKPSIDYSLLVNQLNGNTDYYMRWQKQGDEKFTNVPSFIYPLNPDREDFYRNAEINVLRGDNIRLQDVRLQYAWMPNKTLKRVAAYMYLNNLNLILWRKNNYNLDPDFVGSGNFITPTPRTWTAGLAIDL